MRVPAILLACLLTGCAGGVKLRSPVKEAPALQSPVTVDAKPAPAERCPPVYSPVVDHNDEGEDPCPGGVCRLDRKPALPGYDVPVKAKARNSVARQAVGLGLILMSVGLLFLFLSRRK